MPVALSWPTIIIGWIAKTAHRRAQKAALDDFSIDSIWPPLKIFTFVATFAFTFTCAGAAASAAAGV